jgi:hypothetical protein
VALHQGNDGRAVCCETERQIEKVSGNYGEFTNAK